MPFKPGDIVTDLDPDSMYEGKQGEVLSCQFCLWGPPEVLVRFDRELYFHYLAPDECVDGVCDIYPPEQLRCDEDWAPDVYARRLFGNSWHTVYTYPHPLHTSQLCMVEGCADMQTQVAWVNCYGSVYNVYVCYEHATQYHAHCMDLFPWRKQSAA